MTQRKAYGLLAEQPLSAREMLEEQRRDIVISAILDKEGHTLVISRYGDMMWELWPFFEQSNVAVSKKIIKWARIPAAFREACKAAAYRYWMVGLPGTRPPCANTLCQFVVNLAIITRYLESLGISSMAEVRPLHISNYVHEMKLSNRLTPASLAINLGAVEKLYRFANQHPDGLSFHPWPESSYCQVAGRFGHAHKQSLHTGKTPLIPPQIAQTLFRFAEDVLKGADAILDKCEAGQRSTYKEKKVTLIRNACFYLLGVLTGMRCEEIVGIEVGAGRTEVKGGVAYHWVKSIEHKTLKGPVEYMMPSMGHEILRILERWSAPLRQRLREQLAEWEADTSIEGKDIRFQRISGAKCDQNRLFLGMGPKGIRAVSGNGFALAMQQFAALAGIDWHLAPHQMRRLYGWTFVRHRLGNLLFLKEQFKHSSLDMSQLYAANPMQDAAIYDEILEELRSQKLDIIQGWLFDGQPLAGGAGKKIMKLRAHDFPNRKAMIEETADKLNLRSTGHGWCLAQNEGCGGACLYEWGRCGICNNSLIDDSFKLFWLEVYRHQVELLDEAQELGAGAAERVYRDLERARTVLKDLGVDIVEGVSGG
jgi:site-specific recombinase XerD